MSPGSLLSATFVLVVAPSKLGTSPHALGVPKTWKILWNQRLARHDQRPGWGSEWPLPVLPTLPTLKQPSPTQSLRSPDLTLHGNLETCSLHYSLPPEGKKVHKNILLVENTSLHKTAHIPPLELRWCRKGQLKPNKRASCSFSVFPVLESPSQFSG